MSYFIKPDRDQLRWQEINLEELIPADHPVRVYWELVEKLDLKELYEEYKITPDSEGRPAFDPKMILVIWCYGYSVGIFSSRKLAEACKRRAEFMWLCGGNAPEYRLLAYFRSNRSEAIEGAFIKLVSALKEMNLIDTGVFYQDGSKAKADASPNSFKRRDEIEEEIKKLKEVYENFVRDGELECRGIERRKEKEIKAKKENLDKALRRAEEIYERRKKLSKKARERYKPEEAKASITDPDCQFMKFKDGGKAPGYNAQICIEGRNEFIVGKRVSNRATDVEELIPVIKEVKNNLGIEKIENYITDSGYYSNKNIEEAIREGVERLIIPIYGESKNEITCKVRELSEEEREKIKARGEKIEKIFAFIKEKIFKFQKFHLRGLLKVNCEWSLICIAYNLYKYYQISSGKNLIFL